MNTQHCGILTALAILVAGCVAQPTALSPAETLARLSTGDAVLTCREPCLGEWQRTQPSAAQLEASGRWPDLAALVLRVNYQDDLSLYYLGEAAMGLGYTSAAASYFRQSTYLSGSTISCRALSRNCGGIDLPRAAYRRLAVLDRAVERPRPRRAAPALRQREIPGPPAAAGIAPAPPEPAAAATQPIVMFPPATEPPPAPPPARLETRPPAAGPPQHPASDFIEPPPAAR